MTSGVFIVILITGNVIIELKTKESLNHQKRSNRLVEVVAAFVRGINGLVEMGN